MKAPLIQRKCGCGAPTSAGAGACADCARKKKRVQARLQMGASHDPLEREADRVADQVLAHDPIDRVRRAPVDVRRLSAVPVDHCEAAPESVETVIASGGRPLPSALRRDMERRFGHDFSSVRVHEGAAADVSARAIGARAYTVGADIAFAAGAFAPGGSEGRRLIAHELTHVVQQCSAGRRVQRDLAIEPQVGSPTVRALSEEDIRAAIKFNDTTFDDPYSLAVIRDVIGISRFPAVSDRDLALAVGRWQAAHGVAQDGKLGQVTLTYVIEELQAEGNDADAALLMLEFPRGTFLDVDTRFCECIPRLERQREESRFFIGEYTACGADAANTTGDQIEDCVKARATARGERLVAAGTTDSSGTVRVARRAGPCGPLLERLVLAHEQIHAVHTGELRQQHGRGTRAFNRAFDNAADWVADEINSRRTDMVVADWAIGILRRICP